MITILNRHHERKFCCSGCTDRVLYAPVLSNDDNRVHLEVTGHLNLHDAIQACAELTDISQLVRRFNAGDESALNQRVSFFGDATIFHGMSMRDLIENQRSIERFYAGIGEDAKKANDIHNFNDFITKALKGEIKTPVEPAPAGDPPAGD